MNNVLHHIATSLLEKAVIQFQQLIKMSHVCQTNNNKALKCLTNMQNFNACLWFTESLEIMVAHPIYAAIPEILLKRISICLSKPQTSKTITPIISQSKVHPSHLNIQEVKPYKVQQNFYSIHDVNLINENFFPPLDQILHDKFTYGSKIIENNKTYNYLSL